MSILVSMRLEGYGDGGERDILSVGTESEPDKEGEKDGRFANFAHAVLSVTLPQLGDKLCGSDRSSHVLLSRDLCKELGQRHCEVVLLLPGGPSPLSLSTLRTIDHNRKAAVLLVAEHRFSKWIDKVQALSDGATEAGVAIVF